MSTTIKKHGFKILFGLISMINLYFFISESNNYCDNQIEFDENKYHGKIIKKFINYRQHAEPTIILRNESIDKLYDTLYLLGDISKCFEKLQVNDQILKRENSDSIFITENTKVIFVDRVNFGCE